MNSTGQTITQRRRIHLGLILGAIVVVNVVIGWLAHTTTSEAVLSQLEDRLGARRQALLGSLDSWLRSKRLAVEVLALRGGIRSGILDLAQGRTAQREDLRAILQSEVFGLGFDGFAVVDPNGKVLVGRDGDDDHRAMVGEAREALLAALALPSTIVAPKPDPLGKDTPPVFLAFATVAQGEKVVAALVLSIDPNKEFSRILAQQGGGLTVAFDRQGRVLNHIVNDSDPTLGGRLPTGTASPILAVTLDENIPAVREAIAGRSGMSFEPQLDLRDRPSVGAWTWFDQAGIGLWTSLDHSHALRPIRIVTWSVLGIVGLLTLGTVLAGFWLVSSRILAGRLQRAQAKINELGQYQLVKKIGEGGMGAVYLAQHRLMRRETAVKLISGNADNEAVARFEREVRLCCQLTHPNTIQIYDYGRTADGTFYYAMERLRGSDLEVIVTNHGPLDPGRVIHLLVQACGSLAEAHRAKLIHRDIKPANIFICERGGLVDVVKVLDFGLVKQTENQPGSMAVSQANIISGTPPYMAPEIIGQKEGVDGRSDLYALACVGYFLLTGRCVFEHSNVMDTLMAHLNTPPTPPSQLGIGPVPADLEAVLLHGLAKDPAQRYSDAEAFAAELEACADARTWTQAKARAWWVAHPADVPVGSDPTTDRRLQPTMTVSQPDLSALL